MDDNQLPEVLELDYNSWRCGGMTTGEGVLFEKPGQNTYLYDPAHAKHNCCCLGLMLLKAGAPRHTLIRKELPTDVHDADEYPEAARELLEQLEDTWVRNATHRNDGDPLDFVSIYKSPEHKIGTRITELERLMLDHGIPVKFINIPEDVQPFVKHAYAG
jgi:hypothetical protein